MNGLLVLMWLYHYSSISVYVCLDLEVRVLNTETDSQDLFFPQNGPSDSSIQLSASTFKQYSRNGQSLSLPLLFSSLTVIPPSDGTSLVFLTLGHTFVFL